MKKSRFTEQQIAFALQQAEIDAGTAESWNTLTPERFRSITATGWVMRES